MKKLIRIAHRLKDSTYLAALLMLVCKEHNKGCLDVAKMNVKAVEKLYQECPICLTKHPKDAMIGMAHCSDIVMRRKNE